MSTSTVIQNVSAVKTGKMYIVSGVVRSTNQYAPPFLNEGIFSAMFVTCQRKIIIERSESNKRYTRHNT